MTILSESDEWETPSDTYYDLICQYNFNPTLDVCATEKNSMLDNFYTIKDNSLNQKWDEFNWCNPPNSKPNKELFMKKAHDELFDNGNQTLMIVPADSLCTVYAKKYVLDPKIHYKPITRRIKFLVDGEETEFGNAKKGYFSIMFRRKI